MHTSFYDVLWHLEAWYTTYHWNTLEIWKLYGTVWNYMELCGWNYSNCIWYHIIIETNTNITITSITLFYCGWNYHTSLLSCRWKRIGTRIGTIYDTIWNCLTSVTDTIKWILIGTIEGDLRETTFHVLVMFLYVSYEEDIQQWFFLSYHNEKKHRLRNYQEVSQFKLNIAQPPSW